ncbi:MAG: hypothetical protein V7K47_29930 [Nostoc sp.]
MLPFSTLDNVEGLTLPISAEISRSPLLPRLLRTSAASRSMFK